jgi:hypothetical protein
MVCGRSVNPVGFTSRNASASTAQGSVTDADTDVDAGLTGVDTEVLVTEEVDVVTPGVDVVLCDVVVVETPGVDELFVDGGEDAIAFRGTTGAGCAEVAAVSVPTLENAWDCADPSLPPHAATLMTIASTVATLADWRKA